MTLKLLLLSKEYRYIVVNRNIDVSRQSTELKTAITAEEVIFLLK